MKRYVKASEISTNRPTLADVVALISPVDTIAIHDHEGDVAFVGKCADFRSGTNRTDLLSEPVHTLRAHRDTILILLV